ncbi:MAG TPA: antibiotic biosynthesis monooxygenase [Mycobacterium sp.]|nr:antibiotic biosynthesis monooxygenase [Mycobacterium sp.]
MYARSTTIRVQPAAIDTGIAFVRDEVLPTVQAVDGCIGVSLLVDRASARCIFTSAWETAEALRAGLALVQPMRTRTEEMFGSLRQAQQWEIAALHRDHRAPEGACARVTWVIVDPSHLDAGIDLFKMSAMPDIENLEGFCSASLMVDRASGRSVATVTFDSRDAMERNRSQTNSLRDAVAEAARASVLDECEFELALAHLRVPELV